MSLRSDIKNTNGLNSLLRDSARLKLLRMATNRHLAYGSPSVEVKRLSCITDGSRTRTDLAAQIVGSHPRLPFRHGDSRRVSNHIRSVKGVPCPRGRELYHIGVNQNTLVQSRVFLDGYLAVTVLRFSLTRIRLP